VNERRPNVPPKVWGPYRAKKKNRTLRAARRAVLALAAVVAAVLFFIHH
jgi:hypothetical protein